MKGVTRRFQRDEKQKSQHHSPVSESEDWESIYIKDYSILMSVFKNRVNHETNF